MPTFAERALAQHREKVRDVLVDMFEKPIPESERDRISRLGHVRGFQQAYP